MGRLLILCIPLLLAGCARESPVVAGLASPTKLKGHKVTLVSAEWAMPDQTPLSVGFWGSGAELRVAANAANLKGGEATHSVDTTGFLKHSEQRLLTILGPRTPETKLKLKDPKVRGFVRVVPQTFIGIKTGESGGLKLSGAAFSAGVIYWLQPRKPEIPKGWTLMEQSLGLVQLPLRVTHKGHAGGGASFWFSAKGNQWDLASIDINTQRSFFVGTSDAYDSHLSIWPERKPQEDELMSFSMEPLVFAEVMTYTLKETATGKTKSGKLLTGRIEAAGKFEREGPR